MNINSERVKEWRKNNPDKLKAQRDKWNSSSGKKIAHDKWKDTHPEYKYCPKDLELHKEKRKIYGQNHRTERRKYLLKYVYNMSFEDYESLLDAQDGVCAICGKEEPVFTSLTVDHDHETGRIRGLLCSRCNAGIGHFGDNAILLEKAVRYLNEF